jgi:hypothetical protein
MQLDDMEGQVRPSPRRSAILIEVRTYSSGLRFTVSSELVSARCELTAVTGGRPVAILADSPLSHFATLVFPSG